MSRVFGWDDPPAASAEEEQRQNQHKVERILVAWATITSAGILAYALHHCLTSWGWEGARKSLMEGLRVFSNGFAIALGTASIGGLLGFLFGVPNVQASPRAPKPAPAATASAAPAAGSAVEPASPADDYQQTVNSNLSQISDWLTKTLVGVGLTQIGRIPEQLMRLVHLFKAGVGGSESFTLALILDSLVLGFMAGYLETRLFLSVAFSIADRAWNRKKEAEQQAKRQVLRENVSSILEGKDEVETIQDRLRPFQKMAQQLVQEDKTVGAAASPARLLEDAKLLYVAGHPDRAEELLRKADALKRNDPDILFYLAYMLIQQDTAADRPEATAVLERVIRMPGAKAAAWKLLGYAYLFIDGKAKEAEAATRKYLEDAPGDAGALLNLACAMGQQGYKEPANVARVVDQLRLLFGLDEGYRKTVEELCEPGGDFAGWMENVAAFKKLLDE